MSLFDSLPHSVTILGPPLVIQDAAKGEVISWPAVRYANVPCLIAQGQGGERDEFSQSERQAGTHTIAFAGNDVSPQTGDMLVNDATGAKYRYTGGRPQQGVGGIDDWNLITVREMD